MNRSPIDMRVFSRQALTDSVSAVQINALSCFRDGLMRPEKWAAFEPIKKIFDTTQITEAVRELTRPGTFLFKKPNCVSGAIWN